MMAPGREFLSFYFSLTLGNGPRGHQLISSRGDSRDLVVIPMVSLDVFF